MVFEILYDPHSTYFPKLESKLEHLHTLHTALEWIIKEQKHTNVTICHTGIRHAVMLTLHELSPVLNGELYHIYFPQGGIEYFIKKLVNDLLSSSLSVHKAKSPESWKDVVKGWLLPEQGPKTKEFLLTFKRLLNTDLCKRRISQSLYLAGQDAESEDIQLLIKKHITDVETDRFECPIDASFTVNLKLLLELTPINGEANSTRNDCLLLI